MKAAISLAILCIASTACVEVMVEAPTTETSLTESSLTETSLAGAGPQTRICTCQCLSTPGYELPYVDPCSTYHGDECTLSNGSKDNIRLCKSAVVSSSALGL